ncbi:hypothetical protein ACFE04_026118 [Oxalis oulophora]
MVTEKVRLRRIFVRHLKLRRRKSTVTIYSSEIPYDPMVRAYGDVFFPTKASPLFKYLVTDGVLTVSVGGGEGEGGGGGDGDGREREEDDGSAVEEGDYAAAGFRSGLWTMV